MKNKAVFFDRDGVINEITILNGKTYPPYKVEDVIIIQKTKELIKYLSDNGWLIIVVSNQPDVARNIQTKQNVEKINNYIQQQIPEIDDFFVCYHDNEDNCQCRKPKSGMLLDAFEKYDIDLSQSYMIGDRATDIQAGKNAGCKTIFVDFGYEKKIPLDADYIFYNISKIKEIII